MPRKPLKTETISDVDVQSETEKPKRRRTTTKKTVEVPIVVDASAGATESTGIEPVKAKSRRRTKAVAPIENSEPIQEDGLSVRFRTRSESTVSQTTTKSADSEAATDEGNSRLAAVFRNRKSTKKPTSETQVPGLESRLTSVAGPDDLPVVFRARATAEIAASPAGSDRAARERRRKSERPVELAPELQPSDRLPLEFSATEEDGIAIAWRAQVGKSEPKKQARVREDAAPSTSEAATTEIPERVPEPVSPPRLPISIPSDAPQIVLRNGLPTLVRDHRVCPPLMLFGKPSDARRTEIVLEEIRMAAESGVHLHMLPVEFEVRADSGSKLVGSVAEMIAQVVAQDADAQVVLAIQFRAASDWQRHFPEAVFHRLNGSIAEPSVCDDAFWKLAEAELQAFISGLSARAEQKHFLGVHLDRNEWFLAEEDGYDDSIAATKKFREWARTRYNGDVVAIRASWFDGSVRFDDVEVPAFLPEGADGERFLRASRRQRRYVDYHLFLSDETVRRIRDLAYAVKDASNGYCLVGASYGYTFEWSHPSSGHLALGKLLRTEEIDYIAGPPTYRSREPGGTGSFPAPLDSFALNSKLYISLEDYRTSLGDFQDEDRNQNPLIRTPQALESVHWRGAGAALAHGAGAVWMDTFGSGWLRTGSVWSRAAKLEQAHIMRMEAAPTDPEVAVFIDERSLAYLVDPNAFQLLVQNVRESVLRAGVSVGFYLLSDLAHREVFPESKLYLFVNAWDIRPELRSAIKTRLQKDGKVLFWLYTAGMFESGRDALERAREVTGIALKPQPFYCKAGTTLINRRHALSLAFPEPVLNGHAQLEPSYFAIPEEAQVLGEYTQTGLASFVIRDFDDADGRWTSVFLGEPVVTPALIRSLAQMAGAHVWNFMDDVVHVQSSFLTIHCTGNGVRSIALPEKYSAYDLIGETWAAIDTGQLRLNAVDGSTYVFLVGPKAEVEHLLRANPSELLRIEDIPERSSNLRRELEAFDVPVMKLGEWMSGAETEEGVDEWFLRPTEMEELPAETAVSEEVGHRRRRRRGRFDRNERRPSEFHAPEAENPDQVVNVMFRKRD
jgi:hypothetical protein